MTFQILEGKFCGSVTFKRHSGQMWICKHEIIITHLIRWVLGSTTVTIPELVSL